MRITLIHNPSAGNQSGGEGAAGLVKVLEGAGHTVRYQSAKDKAWKQALAAPADLVVVAGGDGTVGRVARRMAGREIPVALLPFGTANNIARTLGQLERPLEELVRGWEGARRVRVDLPTARGPWGTRYFVEALGLGLFARLLARAELGVTKVRGVLQGLRRLKQSAAGCEALELTARLDGEDISGRYLMFEALNLSHVGPNLFLSPEAEPGDGELDLVLVSEDERERLVHYLREWQENPERLAVLPSRRGRLLELEWTGCELHIDDKLYPRKKAGPEQVAGTVEVRTGEASVEFLVPDARRH